MSLISLYLTKPQHDIVSFPVVIILIFPGICFWKVKKNITHFFFCLSCRMVMRLLLKRLKNNFHRTLHSIYIFIFQTTKTTIYIAKILSSKKSSFFNFFSFPEERHPVVPLPILFFRYSELPEKRHPVVYKSGVVTAISQESSLLK